MLPRFHHHRETLLHRNLFLHSGYRFYSLVERALWEQNNWTKIFWAVFFGMITLLAIVKPFLKMPEEIEKYSTLHTGYRALYLNLHSIAAKIRRKSKVTSEIQELFDAAQDQYKSLVLNDVVNIDNRILEQCQLQVNRETPVESLWYPPRQGECA